MTDTEKLIKASVLLGVALGGLKAMYWTRLEDEDSASCLFESMDGLIKLLENEIDKLFYGVSND